jgi:cyclic pyranopterin phosphate synthase
VLLSTSRRVSGGTPQDGEPRVSALLDRAERRVRYLRVSLTDRCNYRCTYCMPDGPQEFGRRDEVLRLEEVVELVGAFAKAGIERVRLTGGEPTLRRGLVELVGNLAAIRGVNGPLEVVMTTNGERLATMAADLRAAGLHALTVSLDSLDPDRFVAITRRGSLDRVIAGIDAARAAGFDDLKLNTVAIRGFNDDELARLATWAWARDLVPRFIELMPMSDGALFVPGRLMAAAEVRHELSRGLSVDLAPRTASEGAPRGPATYHVVQDGPWAGRTVGTIAAMTENFCSACNRLRLSATGQLHGCLAHDDAGDLRGVLRSRGIEAIDDVVQQVLGTKRDGHGFQASGRGGPRKAMNSIGG